MNTYDEQSKYFSENRQKMLARYGEHHAKYVDLYDDVLRRSNTTDKRGGVTLALLLRAAVYTNTSYSTALEGHVEESRMLLRSPVELMLLAFLVSNSSDVWALWQDCWEIRLAHTDERGVVQISEFNDTRFNVNTIVKTHGKPFASSQVFADLKRMRGELSTYYSHSNLYNVVPRFECLDGKTTVYIGHDAESENNRMDNLLSVIIDIMTKIRYLAHHVG